MSVSHLRFTSQIGSPPELVRELDLTMDLRGLLKLASPYLLWGFRKENIRTLAQLKRYLEARFPPALG